MWLRRGSEEKKALLAFARRGDIVVEVGANVGHYTLLLAELVGDPGHVYAVEPVAESFAMLAGALAGTSHAHRVTPFHCALGDVSCEAEIIVPGSDRGQASLREHATGTWASSDLRRSERCEVWTMDHLFGSLSRLDLVKIDVEGAELLVLRGGRGILTRCAPLLYIEVARDWTRSFGHGPEEVIGELRGLGYDEIWGASDRLVPLASVDFAGSVNLLCGRGEEHRGTFSRYGA